MPQPDDHNCYSVLYGLNHEERELTACCRLSVLKGKAKRIVKLLRVEQNLKAVRPLPKTITCGGLRKAIRSIYGSELSLVQELSIKTSAKAEAQRCDFCKDLQEDMIDKWKSERLQPVEVDIDHLDTFAKAFSENIPSGWNLRDSVFVPNGHATSENSRCTGGNWNEEEFSPDCSIQCVVSSGKERVITLYSSYNTEILYPLHRSLYTSLAKRNWLLVGNPTDERLRYMQDGCMGTEWLSFDYEKATDNIKTAYVQRAVEELIRKGVGLTDDQIRCLQVVAHLKIDGQEATTGQPMGSLMSFPLLCAINKTVVDLALTSLLKKGKISFKEWTSHRCLINGDDLLTRSTSGGALDEEIFSEGGKVGLRSNSEKTLKSPEYAEINSTVFRTGARQKKTNVAALWMGAEVSNVLEFANEATTNPRGFRMVVKNNVSRLARQKIKTSSELPFSKKVAAVSCPAIKRALLARPDSEEPKVTNLFPVEFVPDGFDLSRTEQIATLRREVKKARECKAWSTVRAENIAAKKKRKNISSIPGGQKGKFLSILKVRRTIQRETVLSCWVREWESNKREELRIIEAHDTPGIIVSDLCRIEAMLDHIKAFKVQRKLESGHIPSQLDPSSCPFSKGDGYVSLTDD